MTDGEARQKSDWEVAYSLGFGAGYLAAQRELTDSWRRQRDKVFVAGEFAETSTAAERNAARLAVIREAHAAGIHGAGVPGCPTCMETTGPKEMAEGRQSYVCGRDCPAAAASECVDPREPNGCTWEDHKHAKSPTHHNGDYGVVPPRPTEDEYASLPVLDLSKHLPAHKPDYGATDWAETARDLMSGDAERISRHMPDYGVTTEGANPDREALKNRGWLIEHADKHTRDAPVIGCTFCVQPDNSTIGRE